MISALNPSAVGNPVALMVVKTTDPAVTYPGNTFPSSSTIPVFANVNRSFVAKVDVLGTLTTKLGVEENSVIGWALRLLYLV